MRSFQTRTSAGDDRHASMHRLQDRTVIHTVIPTEIHSVELYGDANCVKPLSPNSLYYLNRKICETWMMRHTHALRASRASDRLRIIVEIDFSEPFRTQFIR